MKDSVEPIFIDEKETARRTGYSRQTLANDRHLGRGFPYIKSGRKVLYFWPDVHNYLQDKKINPEGV